MYVACEQVYDVLRRHAHVGWLVVKSFSAHARRPFDGYGMRAYARACVAGTEERANERHLEHFKVIKINKNRWFQISGWFNDLMLAAAMECARPAGYICISCLDICQETSDAFWFVCSLVVCIRFEMHSELRQMHLILLECFSFIRRIMSVMVMMMWPYRAIRRLPWFVYWKLVPKCTVFLINWVIMVIPQLERMNTQSSIK